MKRLSLILASVVLCFFSKEASAQQGNFVFGLESWGGYTSNGTVPFWLRSNQFGSVPLDGASLSLIGSARKDYDPGKEKLFDWGASLEGRANLGQGSNLTLIEGYGKARLGIFELRAGRSKKITGLCDTILTSGSWAISGNNLGIPEVELSVRDFWTLPWFGELFAFKGNFTHGWIGRKEMSRDILDDTVNVVSFLHQKSLYSRFGKPGWKLKLYAGFNHQVVWGSEQEYYLDDYYLTPVETYLYVITGKKFSNGYIQEERQGNHLGSIDLGFEYQFERISINVYKQSIIEAGGLAHFANLEDGLYGLSIKNRKKPSEDPIISKFTAEVLYTKKQSNGSWSPFPGEEYFEPYYNHGQYVQGWSYRGVGLGTPFIGTREHIRSSLASFPSDYFTNNRIIMYHIGAEGNVTGLNYRIKCSYSQNFGTYLTASPEDSEGISGAGEFGVFGKQVQFSSILELDKRLESGLLIGVTGAYDHGYLYYNSFGMFIRVSYSFSL